MKFNALFKSFNKTACFIYIHFSVTRLFDSMKEYFSFLKTFLTSASKMVQLTLKF